MISLGSRSWSLKILLVLAIKMVSVLLEKSLEQRNQSASHA